MNRVVDPSWYEQLPKVELHLHLEGAIPYQALWNLIQKYGGENKIKTIEGLKNLFKFKDFNHFIETWIWKNKFIREYEDFTLISESVAQDLKEQNVLYAEIFYSPPDFFNADLKTQQITEAIRKGLDKVKGIEISLIIDLVRDFGPDQGEITLLEAEEVKHFGIVGVGIGGSENKYPPEIFESVFKKAKHLGFFTSAHAGETSGPGSIWGAIKHLKVDRIGHGTKAEQDRELLDYIVDNRIPIEMCPISNVCTGSVPSYESHPIQTYFEKGVLLSVNTDDPKMFGNSLAEEYRLLAEKKDFLPSDIKQLILNAVEMSWMTEEKKQKLISSFERYSVWNNY